MTIQSICIWLLLALLIIPCAAANDQKSSEGHQVYEFIKQQQKMLKQQQKQMLALQQQLQEQKQLQAQLKQQQQQIEALRQLVLDQQQIDSKLKQTERKVKVMTRKSARKVKVGKKGLRIQSSNGDYAFQAGGRIHADYAHYNDNETRMGNGASLRRARLYFKGKFLEDWRYKAEIEFAESSKVGPRGVWIGYHGWRPVSLKLGNFQEPFSLEEMGGSNAITFMERSLGNSFAPSYHLGIGASSHGNFWSLSTGVFGKSVGNKDDTVDDRWGVALRTTVAPILTDDKLLHFGFSGEYRRTDNRNQIRLRSRPESNVTNRRLVDTHTINDVETTVLLGAEFAALYGPVSIQGEYFHNRVVRKQTTNLDFNAAYLQGSWLITGESRNYQAKRGVFGLIHPLKKYGAWELALRYSLIDLDDHDIKGGKQNNFTLGLNWYVNYNLRFMINYIFVNAHPNRNAVNESPNILQMRGQLVF